MIFNNVELICYFTNFVLALLSTVSSWEYCKPEIQQLLCPKPGVNHTVCDPSQAFDDKVNMIAEKFLAHVPISRKVKRILMHIHNDYRNRIASGKEFKNVTGQPKYPIASRMRELVWDNELMYVAHIHTRQARMGHDKCRATQRFRNAGQNLGWKGVGNYAPVLEMLNNSLHDMYLEKDLVPDPVQMAANYTIEVKKSHAGHFTAMMSDRVSRLGCAISVGLNCKNSLNNKEYPWCYYLGCNYDFTNIIDDYIYKTDPKTSGTQCSDWGVGKTSKYEHLCANSGELFDPWL